MAFRDMRLTEELLQLLHNLRAQPERLLQDLLLETAPESGGADVGATGVLAVEGEHCGCHTLADVELEVHEAPREDCDVAGFQDR